jgi:hypothetical protein
LFENFALKKPFKTTKIQIQAVELRKSSMKLFQQQPTILVYNISLFEIEELVLILLQRNHQCWKFIIILELLSRSFKYLKFINDLSNQFFKSKNF